MTATVLTFVGKTVIIFLSMKKNLTIIVCNKFEGEISAPYDDIELLYTDGDYDSADIIKNAVKQANGKYIAFCDGAVEILNAEALTAALQNASCDVMEFNGGMFFKASVVRAVSSKDITGRVTLEIKAALNAKDFVHTGIAPLNLHNARCLYSDENSEMLLSLIDDFNKQKSKVSKETYAYAREMLCDVLYYFYADAMLKIRKGGLDSQTFAQFDEKLKENIVLYLALGQKFKKPKLQKIRDKKFKIGLFDEPALKSILK